MKLYNKVLVANRGEIACRIIKTCNKLKIPTVAIFSEADKHSFHKKLATQAINIGAGPPSESYLKSGKIIDLCKELGVDGIHPGYGFLSESHEFAQQCEENGISYIGPHSTAISLLGQKHTCREIAQKVGLPVVPGSPILSSLDEALNVAEEIGYPVMLKATGGGGGIGLYFCRSPADVIEQFEKAKNQGKQFFNNPEVFLEKYIENPKHVEVQVFGDGRGNAVHLWERECSVQRRHQKLVEEAPSNVSESMQSRLTEGAIKIAKAVNYRSAGTVEFLVDEKNDKFYFLEVNTRLQVEHGITELITGVDLVEWMLRASSKEGIDLSSYSPKKPTCHAIEVRICAENPALDYSPSPGTVTHSSFPSSPNIRVDSFFEDNKAIIPPYYDSLVCKLMVTGKDRSEAVENLGDALYHSKVEGVTTNLPLFTAIQADPRYRNGEINTSFLSKPILPIAQIKEQGLMTTIQDRGRENYWHVGVPPSGAIDSLSHRISNILVGNPENAPSLEIITKGPSLSFSHPSLISVCGGEVEVMVNDKKVEMFSPIVVHAGDVLSVGKITQGQTAYLSIRGGFDVPEVMGSSATFPYGKMGGMDGRVLRRGDRLVYGTKIKERDLSSYNPLGKKEILKELYSEFSNDGKWKVKVVRGPHSSPDFFTQEGEDLFYSTPWKVHYNSNRLGVRLDGPTLQFARQSGGAGGSHPSNVQDCPYSVGTINFTGDFPVIIGVDGPSLGGFVCIATITSSDLWKVGQVRPTDTISFSPYSLLDVYKFNKKQDDLLNDLKN